MNPALLNPVIDIAERAERMIEQLAAAKTAPGSRRILYPGQLEQERERAAMEHGLDLPDAALDALRAVSEACGPTLDMESIRFEE